MMKRKRKIKLKMKIIIQTINFTQKIKIKKLLIISLFPLNNQKDAIK